VCFTLKIANAPKCIFNVCARAAGYTESPVLLWYQSLVRIGEGGLAEETYFFAHRSLAFGHSGSYCPLIFFGVLVPGKFLLGGSSK
jgi:hypothetical protein